MGRTSKYFDLNAGEQIGQFPVRRIPGFYASTQLYSSGLYLAIESVNKFECQETIYEMLMKDESSAFSLKGNSCMTNWGDRQIYRIDFIDTKQTPLTNKFVMNGTTEVTMAEYF